MKLSLAKLSAVSMASLAAARLTVSAAEVTLPVEKDISGSAIPELDLSSLKAPEAGKALLDGSFTSIFASRYVGSGFLIGKGPVNQSVLSLNTSSGVSAFMWTDYDFGDKAFHEVDLGLSYGREVAKFWGGTVSARLGYQYWFYPSGMLGNHDNLVRADVNYVGSVKLDLAATYVCPNRDHGDGVRITAEVSKPLQVKEWKSGASLHFIPSISTDYLHGFFQEHSSFSHVSPGIALSFRKNAWSLDGFVKQQISLDRTKESFTWGGVGVNYNF